MSHRRSSQSFPRQNQPRVTVRAQTSENQHLQRIVIALSVFALLILFATSTRNAFGAKKWLKWGKDPGAGWTCKV